MASGKGMDDLANKTAQNVNVMLADQEAEVLRRSSANLAALKPQVSDPAAFDKLVEAVQESTAKNESVAQLKDRVVKLGAAVVKVAKEVAPYLV